MLSSSPLNKKPLKVFSVLSGIAVYEWSHCAVPGWTIARPKPPLSHPTHYSEGRDRDTDWRNHPLLLVQMLTGLVQCNSIFAFHCFWKRSRSHCTFTMGKVEGGMKCVKYLLFAFNFIFWVSNAVVLYIHAIMCGILVGYILLSGATFVYTFKSNIRSLC